MSLNPALFSDLQSALSRKGPPSSAPPAEAEESSATDAGAGCEVSQGGEGIGDGSADGKPIVLVTNSDGIDSPGLASLVEALVERGICNVFVCAPQSEKLMSGHAVTIRETIVATSAEMNCAAAFEITGTPADCVSLALSGALFSWGKPLLVISGINSGSSCGHDMLYSGAVAGAKEALISGVPSFTFSLNWKKEKSQENDFKDAISVCLPLIDAAIKDIAKGAFPQNCALKVEIPTSPPANKGFKVIKQSTWRSNLNWQAVSANRHPSSANFMSNQQSLGAQLAQLGRDASAAGAARRLTTQKKNLEVVESVGAAGKSDTNKVKKFFRLEVTQQHEEDADENLDVKALEDGYVVVTPISLSPNDQSAGEAAVSEWISNLAQEDQ
ncbi:hypothetical protein MLD38_005203 [Melastoma candidum]|uniref:Uncharacterized protein n=1 Tax=Melastoma candidum TaxID=119954 RepID=A0ACB9S8X6_9MYRT|nr:hypothetical protein MLD38_005203 [Melastoma candidum]